MDDVDDDQLNAVEIFRRRLARLEVIHPLQTLQDVEAVLGPPPEVGTYLQRVYDDLKGAIPGPADVTFDLSDLRRIENTFHLEAALDPSRPAWALVFQVVRYVTGAQSPLRPPEDDCWNRILLLARAVLILGHADTLPDPRMSNVAAAAGRMSARGYRLAVLDGHLVYDGGELERATTDVLRQIAALGHADFLGHLFGFLRQKKYIFGQYLLPRLHSTWGQRVDPWLPVGFLLHLTVQVPRMGTEIFDRHSDAWERALTLATDLVATLDLQDYGPWGLLNVEPRRLEPALARLALGDHLFGLRQWPLRLASKLLTAFFAEEGKTLDTKTGWGLDNVLPLIQALASNADQPDPQTWHRDALLSRIPGRASEAVLERLTHPLGSVNTGYVSPLAASAEGSRLMFKPFVAVDDDLILIPALSLVGPATYEACIEAYRQSFGNDRANHLLGEGCERVVRSLLDEAGFPPSAFGKKYKLGKQTFECDLVVESDTHILLIEAKAKALTRLSMAGVPGAALFDFARNLLASQLQALQHERLLRRDGQITFLDGSRLEWNGRDIVRLSVSLLEQASLQDRMVLWHLYRPLLRAQVNVPPGHPQAGAVNSLNRALEALRDEATQLEELGLTVDAQCFGSSLSAAQLAVYLEGTTDLTDLVSQLDQRVTTMSLNPLFEVHQYQSSGLLDAARARRKDPLSKPT